MIKYLKLRYDINSRNGGVNCWTLYCKVIKDKFGFDMPVFRGISNSKGDIASEFEIRLDSGSNHIEISKPRDYDLVIFKIRQASNVFYHCGVWLNGKVLHANGTGMSGGVWYDKLQDIEFETVRFYRHESI